MRVMGSVKVIGAPEGTEVGCREGCDVGLVGLEDGCDVGIDGLDVGSADGTEEGWRVG
jgi:hypothetical protein